MFNYLYRSALKVISGVLLLILSSSAFAFSYNYYDIHSGANCYLTPNRASGTCDIRTGSDGVQSNKLTGVVVVPGGGTTTIKVCGIRISTGKLNCTVKSAQAVNQVVFETAELNNIRGMTPWWDTALMLVFTGNNVDLNGYKVFYVK